MLRLLRLPAARATWIAAGRVALRLHRATGASARWRCARFHARSAVRAAVQQKLRGVPAEAAVDFSHGLEIKIAIPLLDRVQLRLVVGEQRRVLRHRDERALDRLDAAAEDTVQRIVVLGRHGIELVIVAARARDRESEEALRHRVNAVVDDVVLVGETLAHGEEAERRQRRRALRVRQFVRGDLLDDELVVRLVVVERADDVVAIRPRVGIAVAVARIQQRDLPRGVRVARGVEPVPAPAFAEMRRAQQAIHDVGEGVRRSVREKGAQLIRRRRQADEIESDAPQQSLAARRWRRLHALRFELREDESVHRRLHPRRRFHRGKRGRFHRLKRPVPARVVVEVVRWFCSASRRRECQRDHRREGEERFHKITR